MEGEAEGVAGGDEVGESVDVGGYVVRVLGVEGGEEGLQGFGEDEWGGGWFLGVGECCGGCSLRD